LGKRRQVAMPLLELEMIRDMFPPRYMLSGDYFLKI